MATAWFWSLAGLKTLRAHWSNLHASVGKLAKAGVEPGRAEAWGEEFSFLLRNLGFALVTLN